MLASVPDLYALDIEALKELVLSQPGEKLRRLIFGRKSEKLYIQLDQLDLQLEEMRAIHAALASVAECDPRPDCTGATPARKPLAAPDHHARTAATALPGVRRRPSPFWQGRS